MSYEITDIYQLVHEIKEIFQFITSPQLQEKLFTLKIIFISVSVLFALGIIFFLLKSSYLKEVFGENLEDLASYKDFGLKKRLKRWRKIKKKLERSKNEARWKICLIEAEKFLNQTLKEIGYGEGELDEKLKKLTKNDVSDLDHFLRAHQPCQDVIRDPDYRLTKERTQEVIENFEKALKELGAF
jgi:hypothetical protein